MEGKLEEHWRPAERGGLGDVAVQRFAFSWPVVPAGTARRGAAAEGCPRNSCHNDNEEGTEAPCDDSGSGAGQRLDFFRRGARERGAVSFNLASSSATRWRRESSSPEVCGGGEPGCPPRNRFMVSTGDRMADSTSLRRFCTACCTLS